MFPLTYSFHIIVTKNGFEQTKTPLSDTLNMFNNKFYKFILKIGKKKSMPLGNNAAYSHYLHN